MTMSACVFASSPSFAASVHTFSASPSAHGNLDFFTRLGIHETIITSLARRRAAPHSSGHATACLASASLRSEARERTMSDVKSIDVGGALFVDKCVPRHRELPPFARSRVRRGLGRARSRPPTASSPPRDPRLTAVPAPREPQVLRRQDQGHVLGKALRAVRLGASPNRTPLTTRASSGISRNDFSRALSERARRFRSERLTADSYVSRSNHHGHSVSTRRGPRSGAAPARTRFPTRPCPSTRR